MDTSSLASMVRDARKRQNLSQIELAEKVGMSQRWISDIERGETENPRPEALRRLARVLKIEVADLIYAGKLAGSKEAAQRIADAIPEGDDSPLTPEEEAVLGRMMFMGLQDLSNEQLREIIAIVTRGR